MITKPITLLPVPSANPLEDFILNAQRLAVILGDGGIFAKHNVSLSEWAILKNLVDEEAVQVKQILRRTGISRQRMHKVLTQLSRRGLVSIRQMKEGDKRVRVVAASPDALGIVDAVSEDLLALSDEAGGESRAKSFASAARLSDIVIRKIAAKAKREAVLEASPR